MDDIERAAGILFPQDGSRRTLDVKFGTGGGCVTAQELARRIIHAEEEIKAGRARLVEDVDSIGPAR